MPTHSVEADHFKTLFHNEKDNSKKLCQAIEEIKTYLAERQAEGIQTVPEIKISNILHHHKLL